MLLLTLFRLMAKKQESGIGSFRKIDLGRDCEILSAAKERRKYEGNARDRKKMQAKERNYHNHLELMAFGTK